MDYVKKCEDCGTEFTTQRSDSKFCSDSCRKRTARGSKSDKPAEEIKSDKEAWQKVMDGEPSGVDIGFGPNDYTREMVEDRVKRGDSFLPNWYVSGAKSRNQVTYGQSKHNDTV